MLFTGRDWQWRFDRRLQIADRPVRLAQRQILGGRASHDSFEELFDALHLLLECPLGGCALFVLSVLDAACRFGEAGRDGLVETVGLPGECLPLVGNSAPRGVALGTLGRVFLE